MGADTYEERRSKIETYFDRTAADAWSRLTSDAPVSRIRQTVRAGRDEMRATLLSWLPEDMSGRRLLDAGCGTGALSVEAARRGAHVVAIDLSPTLVELARERVPTEIGDGRIDFHVGDMSQLDLADFDHAVAMDSVIHYNASDAVNVLGEMAAKVSTSILFTFAPGTPLLKTLRAVGSLFPRGDRAPFIEPIGEKKLFRQLDTAPSLEAWQRGRSHRVKSGFYTSQACELQRKG
ncbi:MAG: magnesium protoporphyrin IX methyltransferase [Chromatocurvus sp.]